MTGEPSSIVQLDRLVFGGFMKVLKVGDLNSTEESMSGSH